MTFTSFKQNCMPLKLWELSNKSDIKVELAFKQFDTSGDDKLNYKEFCLMIVKREQER